MKKSIVLLIALILIMTGCSSKKVVTPKNNKEEKEVIERVSKVNIVIDNKEYILNLENNDSVLELVSMLPLSVTMNELNGNEKYVYLDKKITTNEIRPKNITSGDVMLYGDDCLVIFYKSFETSYSYTKIGHIDNLSELGKTNVNVEIKR